MSESLEPSLEVHKRHTFLTLAMVPGFRRSAAPQAVWRAPARRVRGLDREEAIRDNRAPLEDWQR